MFRGSYTALVTPFRNGAFDEARFEEQIAFQAKGGTQGIVPVGTTGESPTVSHAEHRRIIEVAVKAARGTGMKVIAGTGSNSTDEAIELTQFAKQIGADGALIVNPYYNKPSQEGLYKHFEAIVKKTDLPIVLYNIPGRTGITMTVSTVVRLARDFPSIVAIKEATGSLDQASETVINAGGKVAVISGDDSLTLPIMAVGGVGVISVVTNILPREVRTMCDHFAAGKTAEARDIHLRLYPVVRSLFLENNPGGIKAAMQLLGRDTGEMRLPLCDISAPSRMAVRQALINFGILSEGAA
jgi:4-hydroxy-tetrahydrodipicolinate synthase